MKPGRCSAHRRIAAVEAAFLSQPIIDPLDRTDGADIEATLEELAALSPIAYDRRRKEAATRLNIRESTLDSEVYRRRPRSADDARRKRPDEPVERLRVDRMNEFEPLRRQAARCAKTAENRAS